ncbi:shikimate dehydrogenase [Congregibacter litoralis]|uniref:Shikimate dehydrogenase (NADP(+)) n=1 Tax=Congregibacter litoralis KT71 TaxID=314285 RepID=A4A929_9GAMM|nr:shikimate dehydrogenase [Congregibacter litoralis]EAQ97571.1 shikimate 5-dehydrogenase [Congregibacter litoralis KT71]
MSENMRFAVFGNPIKHSRSPMIHAAFAGQCDVKLEYRAVRVELNDFQRAVTAFFDAGGSGLNITVPFKEEAAAMAMELTGRAARATAVNTLWRDDAGVLRGDTTDGVGLVRDMVANLGWRIQGQRVLIVGAGGAVRGVLEPLMRELPTSVHIVNRTVERAETLASEFAVLGKITASGYGDLAADQYDLVINANSAGLSGEMPALPPGILGERSCCYDLLYGAEPTAFMRWAAQNAAWAVSDGLGMLVEQAAEAFYVWHRSRPETQPVIQQLRGVLAAAA